VINAGKPLKVIYTTGITEDNGAGEMEHKADMTKVVSKNTGDNNPADDDNDSDNDSADGASVQESSDEEDDKVHVIEIVSDDEEDVKNDRSLKEDANAEDAARKPRVGVEVAVELQKEAAPNEAIALGLRIDRQKEEARRAIADKKRKANITNANLAVKLQKEKEAANKAIALGFQIDRQIEAARRAIADKKRKADISYTDADEDFSANAAKTSRVPVEIKRKVSTGSATKKSGETGYSSQESDGNDGIESTKKIARRKKGKKPKSANARGKKRRKLDSASAKVKHTESKKDFDDCHSHDSHGNESECSHDSTLSKQSEESVQSSDEEFLDHEDDILVQTDEDDLSYKVEGDAGAEHVGSCDSSRADEADEEEFETISDYYKETETKMMASNWEAGEDSIAPDTIYQMGDNIIPQPTYQLVAHAMGSSSQDLVAMYGTDSDINGSTRTSR